MKTTIIILGILLISCISALDITAGESEIIQLGEDYVYYTISGNTFEVNVNQTGTDVIITTNKYETGSFDITFYNEKHEPLQQQKGGGSSYTKKVKPVVEDKINETIEEEVEETIEEAPEEVIGIIGTPENNSGWKIALWIGTVLFLVGLIWWAFK